MASTLLFVTRPHGTWNYFSLSTSFFTKSRIPNYQIEDLAFFHRELQSLEFSERIFGKSVSAKWAEMSERNICTLQTPI